MGKDSEGNAAVLLSLASSEIAGSEPSVKLEYLSVLSAVRCCISDSSCAARAGLFTVIVCTSIDDELVHQFFLLMGSLVAALADPPMAATAATAIRRTIELFRALATVGTRTVQGLWGELFVIRTSAQPLSLVRAWRVDQDEQFDFSESDMRLEIKTTKLPRRIHRFSLEQVAPLQRVTSVIGSLRTRALANGLTVQQLWDDIRVQLAGNAGLLLRLDEVVVTSLGRNWRRAMGRGFDEQLALASLAFYRAEDIPCVATPVPDEVTAVKFDCDISEVVAMTASDLRLYGKLFIAARPI